MGNLNCCSGGCFLQKARRNIPRRSRTSVTSWMKRVSCWPHNKTHSIIDPDEELSEDKVKEVSNSTLEEEALPASVACEADNEHGIQEDLIEELHQAWAEEQSLKTLKAYSAVCEHASQQVVVEEVHRAWDEEESPRIPKSQEFGDASEHGKYSGINTLLRYNPSDKAGVF
ncbi:unnamed protein product [Rangifer tarandus platyrhynchus]|uniref:Uncharacterized protein n=1 Tax=Rangifer tarandus platyrhynchus TaxID=3082113 RepID=A0ACB1KDB2_RANTA